MEEPQPTKWLILRPKLKIQVPDDIILSRNTSLLNYAKNRERERNKENIDNCSFCFALAKNQCCEKRKKKKKEHRREKNKKQEVKRCKVSNNLDGFKSRLVQAHQLLLNLQFPMRDAASACRWCHGYQKKQRAQYYLYRPPSDLPAATKRCHD